MSECNDEFLQRLLADGPAADRAEKMSLYGWLIGDWRMDCTLFPDDGTTQRGAGEICFRWALGGRAIQDVWILPGVFYGTTLRIYDAVLDAWRIIWSDPLRPYYARQIGRRARTLCRSAKMTTAHRRAGVSATSSRIHSAGAANGRPMTAGHGGCRPTSPLTGRRRKRRSAYNRHLTPRAAAAGRSLRAGPTAPPPRRDSAPSWSECPRTGRRACGSVSPRTCISPAGRTC